MLQWNSEGRHDGWAPAPGELAGLRRLTGRTAVGKTDVGSPSRHLEVRGE